MVRHGRVPRWTEIRTTSSPSYGNNPFPLKSAKVVKPRNSQRRVSAVLPDADEYFRPPLGWSRRPAMMTVRGLPPPSRGQRETGSRCVSGITPAIEAPSSVLEGGASTGKVVLAMAIGFSSGVDRAEPSGSQSELPKIDRSAGLPNQSIEDIAMTSMVLILALGGVGQTAQAPAKVLPAAQAPSKVAPAPQAPAKVMPAPQAPSKVAPAPQAPAKVMPAPQAPTKVAPAPQAPAKVMPAPQAPTKVAPAPQAPAKVMPAPRRPPRSPRLPRRPPRSPRLPRRPPKSPRHPRRPPRSPRLPRPRPR